jgi:glycosyltransferase involved in cell wall biosynthesis
MKILFVFFNSGIHTGGHRRYLELAEGLARRGNEVFLIKNKSLHLVIPPVFVISLPYRHKKKFFPHSLFSLLVIKKHRSFIKNSVKQCDYIITFGETHFFSGLYLKKLLKAKLFHGFRSDVIAENVLFLREDKKFFNRLKFIINIAKHFIYEKIIVKNADIICFQSGFDRDNFKKRLKIDDRKISVIKNSTRESWFKEEYRNINHSTSLKKVLYIGILAEGKGIRYLFDAFRVLKERDIRIELELVGRGEQLESEMRQFAEKNGFPDMVSFAGHSQTPFEFMRGCDLLVLPSIFDSYPNVILEGLHAGIPVIASRVGGIPDILEDDRLLFPPADSRAIAEKLEQLHESAELYHTYRALCQNYLKKYQFDWPGAWETEIKKRETIPNP